MSSEPVIIERPSTHARAIAETRPLRWQMPALLVWLLTSVIATGLAYYHWHWEGWRETIIFASSITAGLIAALTLLTRRILFAVAIIAAMVTMISVASDIKRHYIEMVLHAYDVVFYLTSWSTLSFLWVDHKAELLAIVGAFAATAVMGALLYRHDSSRIPRLNSAAVLIFCISAATWASYAKGERRNTLFFWDNLYLSSFYASWAETLETLWRGQLLDASPTQSQPLFKLPVSCTTSEPPPHIILIHQESVVPPSHFPTLKYDTTLDPFFKSFDGKMHKLRVETYGGASWLTEFSVLAGVSTYSFGGMRTFVQALMQGKIHDTLPQTLARCGYRNSVFYPVPKDFVSNGRFYAATGIPEIFDFKAQGAKRYNERDKFYYGNALKYFGEQLASSRAPLFTFIITSATHLPYQYTYDPDVNVPGGGAGTDPEMNEYLRRLGMAKMDYDAFKSDLAQRFPNEKFLIVQYGDHQPVATRTLLGFDQKLTAEDVKMPPEHPGYVTYYSIDGVNYTPPPMPSVETLEVPYIGTALLEAAGIPLPEDYQERLRLLKLCDGRYYTCPQTSEILGFHRRLIDSGLVDAR
jgi:phosphoglycerol transferase MdoB-like AlkP superfamily enzyme